MNTIEITQFSSIKKVEQKGKNNTWTIIAIAGGKRIIHRLISTII
jgi:hypothetical protein